MQEEPAQGVQAEPITRQGPSGFKRAALLAATAALVVVCIEIGLQLVYRVSVGAWLYQRTGLALYEPNDDSVYRVRKNLDVVHKTTEFTCRYFTDASGFRVSSTNATALGQKTSDVYRILLLGPSFAFGWGVDFADSFGAYFAQAALSHLPVGKRRVELVNAGVPSLPPANNLNWFVQNGKNLAPDLVVQLLYGNPTVWPEPSTHLRADAEGGLLDASLTGSQILLGKAKRLGLVFYPWYFQQNFFARTGSGGKGVLGAGRDMREETSFHPADKTVRSSLKFYDKLRETAALRNARLACVFIPLSYLVHPGDVDRWRHKGVTDPQAQAAFNAQFCDYTEKQRRFPYVDLTPALREAAAADPERLYYLIDVHWTPLGNKIAAAAAAGRIAERKGF